MGTVHLIAGPVGAGKTTYATALASDRRALLFSIDSWMADLFRPDLDQPPGLSWMLERVERCERRIRALAEQALALETEVVLDLGFMRADERRRYIAWAADLGVDHFVHVLDADREVRRERVRLRNLERPETWSFDVDDSMFEWAESWYEPVTQAESLHLIRARTDE